MTLLLRSYKTWAIYPLLVLLVACSGSKALTKKGQKLEEAGMSQEASNMYYTALRKKNSNVDAQIGMKKTGQAVMGEKLNKFSQARMSGNHKDAVYFYLEAENYLKKIQGVGVQLNIAEFFKSDFDEEKVSYLDELYDKGSELMEAERYIEAEKLFSEISSLDPNFKNTGELKDVAYLEPLYRHGMQAYDLGNYREALQNFDQVIQRKADYKDAKSLKSEALSKGQFTVAVMPFTNTTNTAGLDARLSAYALEALAGINDPFLKVVDRDHMQTILDEQRLGLTGVIDEQTAAKVGEIMGAKAIITGTILGYNTSSGKLRSATVPGYESYQVKKYDEVNQKYYYDTQFKKVNYKQYINNTAVSVSFQFKMISLETGEVLLTKIVEREMKDEINYASYNGNANNIFPENNGTPNVSRAAKQNLSELFSGRRELRSSNELSNDLMNDVGKTMTSEIKNILIQKIR